MSYFLSFIDSDGEIHDSEDVASTAGLAAFQEWAGELPAIDYPELTYVAEFGETENISDLEAELGGSLTADRPSGPVYHVARRLLEAIQDRPPNAVGVVITDGTGEDDEGDGEESQGTGGPRNNGLSRQKSGPNDTSMPAMEPMKPTAAENPRIKSVVIPEKQIHRDKRIAPSLFGRHNRVYRRGPSPDRLAALRRQYASASPRYKAFTPKRPRGAPPLVDEVASRNAPVPPGEVLGVRAEPPEVSTTRPRPGNLSRGALGPRKALDDEPREISGYNAHFQRRCTEGEKCPCELCRAGTCQEGTCLPLGPEPHSDPQAETE